MPSRVPGSAAFLSHELGHDQDGVRGRNQNSVEDRRESFITSSVVSAESKFTTVLVPALELGSGELEQRADSDLLLGMIYFASFSA